jgi:solute carrier family 35 (UDP-sugar transporter), member A1/2/3
VQLCVFTIPIAAFGVVLQWGKISAVGALHGFDSYTWVLVTLNGAGGLLVAAVIKYGDNILKNFTTSCSVILGTLMSIVLFDFRPNTQFFMGAALVILSAYIYSVGPDRVTECMGKRMASTEMGAKEALSEDESAPLQTLDHDEGKAGQTS